MTDLYFAEKAKGDTAPGGNKQLTDILLVVAVLILVVAVVNYVNFSVALTPARIRGINTQKVLGCSVGTIRRNIVSEAVMMTVTAYLLALLVTSVVFRHGLLNRLLGNGLSLSDHLPLVGMTFALALIVGAIAGLYPAWPYDGIPSGHASQRLVCGDRACQNVAEGIDRFSIRGVYRAHYLRLRDTAPAPLCEPYRCRF